MLMHWLGYPDSISKPLAECFPCVGSIDVWTGGEPHDLAVVPPERIKKCGFDCICKHCQILTDLVGRSWNYKNLVNYLVHHIRTVCYVCITKDTRTVFHPTRAPHNCGPDCILRNNPDNHTVGDRPDNFSFPRQVSR